MTHVFLGGEEDLEWDGVDILWGKSWSMSLWKSGIRIPLLQPFLGMGPANGCAQCILLAFEALWRVSDSTIDLCC